MGKSKRRSKASRSHLNPLGGKNKSTNRDEAMSVKKIQPLLKQLNSAAPNDRAMALGSVTVLCEDPYMRKLFLKEKLLHLIMSKLLSDDNMEIVVESYGLLRNLALEEGYDVCVFLWRSDIWTCIKSGLEKLLKSLESLKANIKSSAESTRLLFDFGDNLVSLVIALTSGSDSILEDFLKSDKLACMFSVLGSVLNYALVEKDLKVSLRIPVSFFNTILDFIYDLSSESLGFIDAVAQDAFLAEFVKSLPTMQLTNANGLTTVLIQGIYLQFLDMDVSSEQVNEILGKTCSAIETIDLAEMKKSLSTKDFDDSVASLPDKEVSGKIKELNKRRAQASVSLQSIEVTLDIITASLEIVAAQVERANAQLDDSMLQTLTVSLPMVFQSLFADFRSRILIAWNNMLWLYLTLQINFFELPNNMWQHLWDSLVSETPEEQADFSMRLGKLGVMWALLKTAQMQEDNVAFLSKFNCANSAFVEAIETQYNLVQELDPSEDQELKQRCIGILACLASLPGHVELNRQIGQFLIQKLADEHTPAATMIDISDALFDIYSDANFDYDEPVFVGDGFINVLQEKVLPSMRKCFKFVDKNKDPELKARSQSCFGTMERFIHYKVDERK